MKWGGILFHILGLIPYIALSFGVVYLWRSTFGFTVPDFLSLKDTLLVPLQPTHILLSLAILGSWAFWYLFCKLFKFLFLVWTG